MFLRELKVTIYEKTYLQQLPIIVEEESNKENGGCFETGGCKLIDGEMCFTYIYPITDWGNHPGLATITVVIGVTVLACFRS